MRPFSYFYASGVAIGVMMAAATGAIAAPTLTGEAPIVIAHRGASGYLPEHTPGGYELAVRLGADYIEPDLQLTKDGQLVAMHDTTLNRTTNVESLFAARNGGYRVSDFTLAEIKTLTVEPTGTGKTSYPGFTPSAAEPYRVPTFQEVIDIAKQQSALTGRTIGIYPEAKIADPAMEDAILSTLQSNGYGAHSDKVFIQSFSNDTIKSINTKQQALGMDLELVVLGGASSKTVNGEKVYVLQTQAGELIDFATLAQYADGIGVSLSANITAEFIQAAHDAGLLVHGWTFSKSDPNTAFPEYYKYIAMGMDGMFSNYADMARAAVPAPGAVGLLALGLAGLAAARRRKAT